MKYILWFIFGLVFVYIIYYVLFIRNARRDTKHASEVEYLIKCYKLDINKFSYRKFVRVVGLVSSIDVSLTAVIVMFTDELVWQILFGLIIVLPVLIISFMLLGKYYKFKESKDNTKELEKEKKYLDRIDQKLKKKEDKKRVKKDLKQSKKDKDKKQK